MEEFPSLARPNSIRIPLPPAGAPIVDSFGFLTLGGDFAFQSTWALPDIWPQSDCNFCAAWGCIQPYLTRGVMPHRDMHTIHSLKSLRSLHSILDIENVQGIVTFPDHGSRSCMCPNHWPQRAYPVLGLLEPEKRGLRSIARIFSQRSEILLELAVLY